MIGQYSLLEMVPYEILEKIISHCTEKDLFKMSRLNRRFYVYISNMPLWRTLTRDNFGSQYAECYANLPAMTPFFRIYAVEQMFARFERIDIKSLDEKLDFSVGTNMWAAVFLSAPFIYDGVKKVYSLSKPMFVKMMALQFTGLFLYFRTED